MFEDILGNSSDIEEQYSTPEYGEIEADDSWDTELWSEEPTFTDVVWST